MRNTCGGQGKEPTSERGRRQIAVEHEGDVIVSHAFTAQLKPLWGGDEDQHLLDMCAPSFPVW